MDRRDFIKKGISLGLTIGAAPAFMKYADIYSKGVFNEYDLVAVKGGEPEVMFDKAISEIGGMGKFIKKDSKVLIKPNIGWDVSPERAANTNPKLVSRIIKSCYSAGAKKVYVFDNTCDNWEKSYKNSGIEKAVKDSGGEMVPGNAERYYQNVEIPNGVKLKTAKVHELVLDSDVFINVPILKHHSSAELTIAMKNLMGIVWDRGYWHRNDLHQCIADFVNYGKPTLNIIDAYRVLSKNGPRGVSEADVIPSKSLILSRDIVAADAAAAKIFGKEPKNVRYINIAGQNKIGNINLEELAIKRIIL